MRRDIEKIDPSKIVLIVEDDKPTASVLTDEMVLLGVSPSQQRYATSIKSAFEAIKVQKPNLMLLDLILPDGDGSVLIEQNERPTSIVVISAHLSPEVVDFLRRHDVSSISKPFDFVQIEKIVRKYLTTN